MSIRNYRQIHPQIDATAWVDEAAVVIGAVCLGADVSVWPMAVLRGDVDRIEIGARSNIQDGSVLHVTHDGPYSPGGRALLIGEGVTVGHNVVLHACTIGDFCLIGMGAIVMDDAIVGEHCMVAAGAVLTPGKKMDPGTLWKGNPARYVRQLSETEIQRLHYSAEHYVRLKNDYQSAT
jgi:carbonic anhydrase/acetyltransferase-like protein (isoleucine patch superfamily)